MHHNTCSSLGTFVGHCHIGYQRQTGEVNHIVMTLNLITEEVENEQDTERQQETNSGSRSKDGVGAGTHLSLKERFVNKLTLVCCGSQCYAVLLTFLQKQQVETGMNVLLTANLVEHTFLYGSHRHTPQMLGIECL